MDPFLPAGALGNVVTNLIIRPARGDWLTMPLAGLYSFPPSLPSPVLSDSSHVSDTFWDFISELPQLQAVAVEAFADPSDIDELLPRLIQSIAVHARDTFRTLSVSRVLRRRYAYMESRFTPSHESTIVTALAWAALDRELEQFPNFEGLHMALGVDWYFGGGSDIRLDDRDTQEAAWNDLRDKYPSLKLSYPLSSTSGHSINVTSVHRNSCDTFPSTDALLLRRRQWRIYPWLDLVSMTVHRLLIKPGSFPALPRRSISAHKTERKGFHFCSD